MKLSLIVTTLSLLVSGSAFGSSFKCTETAQSKENYNSGIPEIKLEVKSKKSIVLDVNYGKGKTAHVVPRKDEHFKKGNRFIDDQENITGSDSGDTGIFLDDDLASGNQGFLRLSTNQANDGDSGGEYLWYTAGVFECK